MAEAVKTEETPTLAEEKPKEKKKEENPAGDVDGLVAELEKAGISNVEQLENKLMASSQAGNLANQLGDARNEIAELKQMMADQPREVRHEVVEPEEEDLGRLITKGVDRALDAREKKQAEAWRVSQQNSLTMWNTIQNDPDYKLVETVWDTKTKDPNFQFKVQNGLINPLKEFNDTVREYYKGISKRALDTINQLQGKGTVTPVHLEDGGRVPENLVREAPSPSKVETTLKDKREKSYKTKLSEEDELDIIDTLFESPNAPEE